MDWKGYPELEISRTPHCGTIPSFGGAILFDELRPLGEPVYSCTDSLVDIKGAMRDGRITETTVAQLETVELSVISYAQDLKRYNTPPPPPPHDVLERDT